MSFKILIFFFINICNSYRNSSIKGWIFSFQNNTKNLDPSYKTDLDVWDCLGRIKLVIRQNFIGLIQLFLVILERGKPIL